MQVAVRHDDRIRKRPIVRNDTDHRAIRAVIGQLSSAHFARMTRTIDFADNTLTGKPTGPCNPHELVPQRSGKPHVAFAQLQVCLTNPCFDDIDNHFAMARLLESSRVSPELQRFVENYGSGCYSALASWMPSGRLKSRLFDLITVEPGD